MRPTVVALIASVAIAIPCGASAQATSAPPSQAQPQPQPQPQPQAPLRVLFVGNSYTYYNDLPKMLAEMASTAGLRRIETSSETKGGATLERVGALRTTQAAIAGGRWDVVILQEQSALPIVSPEKMHRAVRELDAEIRKTSARTMLYLTWSRQGHPDKQAALDDAYLAIGKELGATVAPVGPAWQKALATRPELVLYANDGSHPSPLGSYVAACVIYLSLLPEAEQCPAPVNRGFDKTQVETAFNAALSTVRRR